MNSDMASATQLSATQTWSSHPFQQAHTHRPLAKLMLHLLMERSITTLKTTSSQATLTLYRCTFTLTSIALISKRQRIPVIMAFQMTNICQLALLIAPHNL